MLHKCWGFSFLAGESLPEKGCRAKSWIVTVGFCWARQEHQGGSRAGALWCRRGWRRVWAVCEAGRGCSPWPCWEWRGAGFVLGALCMASPGGSVRSPLCPLKKLWLNKGVQTHLPRPSTRRQTSCAQVGQRRAQGRLNWADRGTPAGPWVRLDKL